MTTERIAAKIKELSQDVLIETNSGTFGVGECLRATGSGDPKFGEYRVFERLDGSRYTLGTKEGSPGRARYFNSSSVSQRIAEVDSLKLELKSSKSEAAQREAEIAELARGWWGYQFVGIEEGQRRIAAMTASV